jgi:hypothetical protein
MLNSDVYLGEMFDERQFQAPNTQHLGFQRVQNLLNCTFFFLCLSTVFFLLFEILTNWLAVVPTRGMAGWRIIAIEVCAK